MAINLPWRLLTFVSGNDFPLPDRCKDFFNENRSKADSWLVCSWHWSGWLVVSLFLHSDIQYWKLIKNSSSSACTSLSRPSLAHTKAGFIDEFVSCVRLIQIAKSFETEAQHIMENILIHLALGCAIRSNFNISPRCSAGRQSGKINLHAAAASSMHRTKASTENKKRKAEDFKNKSSLLFYYGIFAQNALC